MADDALLKTFKFDFDVRINVRNIRDEKEKEDAVFSHRLVLSSASVLFRGLLSLSDDLTMASIDVDVRSVPNGLAAFKAMLGGLYSGDIDYTHAQPTQVLCVARLCQVPTIESAVLANSVELNPFAMFMQQHNQLFAQNNPVQSYLQSLLALYMQPGFLSNSLMTGSAPLGHAPLLTPPSSNDDAASRAASDGRSEGSSPRTTPSQNDVEKILPSDDKEGWCRNKKYIEKVENGFMCTVCRKVYGRYNSVSYHVTIYHRNPPIRCDEVGCQFSTREARYIHFHKYYRHHIPLPDTIDLGSRKCPFCRHVSKSPAMLEKHVARHEERREKERDEYSCQQCVYSCKTSALLQRHEQFVHSVQSMTCALCPFSASSQSALLIHTATNHLGAMPNSPTKDNLAAILNGPHTVVPNTPPIAALDVKKEHIEA